MDQNQDCMHGAELPIPADTTSRMSGVFPVCISSCASGFAVSVTCSTTVNAYILVPCTRISTLCKELFHQAAVMIMYSTMKIQSYCHRLQHMFFSVGRFWNPLRVYRQVGVEC